MIWPWRYLLVPALWTPAVHCATSFIRPPNFDRGVDEDPSANIRYDEGSSITVMWETDLEQISLAYVQQLDNDRIQWIYLRENVTTTRYTWLAQYDPSGFTTDNEDAVGWFTLNPPGDDDAIRGSQRFNITAPKSASTTDATSTTTLPQRGKATTDATTSTTSTESEPAASSTEATSESNSGLSSGATAGIAVGAVLGGLIILGGLGFLLWRRFSRRSGNVNELQGSNAPTKYHNMPPEMSGSPEPRLELAAEPATPARAVRCHPGLHETYA